MHIRQQQNPKTKELLNTEIIPDIPIVKVLPNKLIYYSLPHYYILQSDKKSASINNLSIKRNNTSILNKSMSKLRDCILYWAHASKIKVHLVPSKLLPIKFRLVFITLTLPAEQRHTDTEIKKSCLNQFLTELRTNHNVSRYVWKCELQKNGNIHFHIVCDVFINHNVVREIWNRCLEKLNYISQFEKQHNHRNPNSTDIEAVRSAKHIGKYISKYISKGIQTSELKQTDIVMQRKSNWLKYCDDNNITDEVARDNLEMKGKKIAVSNSLKVKCSHIEIALGEIDTELQQLANCKEVSVWCGANVSVFQFDSVNLLRLNCPRLYKVFNEVLSEYKSILN